MRAEAAFQAFKLCSPRRTYTGLMLSLSKSARLLLSILAAAGFASVLVQPPAARAWGNGGHRLVNRLAASSLPADVPAFLRSPEAVAEIEYLGPEPDRWRSPAEPELVAAQAPEHFIDLETADALGPLPHRRLDFEARVYAAGERPEKIGLQPWQATEVWERLKAALRQYRYLTAHHEETRPVEQAIIFYAGWLGHYVGDGSQPLHTTHPVQRLGGAESQWLHDWAQDSLAVRRTVCGRQPARARGARQNDAGPRRSRATSSTRMWLTCATPRPMWRGSINWTRREDLWARGRPSRGSLPPNGWLPAPACCAT